MVVGCVFRAHHDRSARGAKLTHTKETLEILGSEKSSHVISPDRLVAIEAPFRGLPHATSFTDGC